MVVFDDDDDDDAFGGGEGEVIRTTEGVDENVDDVRRCAKLTEEAGFVATTVTVAAFIDEGIDDTGGCGGIPCPT